MRWPSGPGGSNGQQRLNLRGLEQGVATGVEKPFAAQRRLGHFGDVDVTVLPDPEAVRRREAVRGAGVGAAPGRQDVAVDVADRSAWTARSLRPDPAGQVGLALLPGHLADVDAVVLVDEEVAGPGHVAPDPQQLAGPG